jgi:hypothetical protein
MFFVELARGVQSAVIHHLYNYQFASDERKNVRMRFQQASCPEVRLCWRMRNQKLGQRMVMLCI